MSKANVPTVTAIFSALGDTTRLGIMKKLDGNTRLSATLLSQGASVTRQNIVKHLQVLEDAGLVRHEKNGREVLYSIEYRQIAEAREFLNDISTGWDRAIDRLRDMVEKAD